MNTHTFLPSINMEPRQKALHPHTGFASGCTSALEHRICNKQISLDRPIKQPFPLTGPAQGQRTPNSLLPDQINKTLPRPLITVSGTRVEAAETQAAGQVGEPVPAGGQTQAAGAQSPAGAQGP